MGNNLFRCAGGGESLNCIAKPYNPNEIYNKNDVVLYNNLLYICIAYNVTGEWDNSKWSQTTLNDLSESNPNIFYGIEWMDDEYDSTAEYNTNDTCMHRGLLYLCLEDGVTGEWDETKWKRTYLLDCTKLNSNLGAKLLWTNESTGSAFKEQTISISSTFDYCIIVFVHDTSSRLEEHAIIMVPRNSTQYYSAIGSRDQIRRDVKYSDTGIFIGNGIYLPNTIMNGYLIPYKIYGINITL